MDPVVEFFRKREEDVLRCAAVDGDVELVKALLPEFGADYKINGEGDTLLHYAGEYGHESLARHMLEVAPRLAAAQNDRGQTPLHCAANTGRGSPAVVRLLLEAYPEAALVPDSLNFMPLHYAATKGHLEAAQMLLEVASISAFAGDYMWTPLDQAIEGVDTSLAQLDHSPHLQIARCILQAAQTTRPALDILNANEGLAAAVLYADLACHLPLTEEEWQLVPAPCPRLARALPAVLHRSTAEAGWLVGRLAPEQRARLRTAAFCLAQAWREVEGAPHLPCHISQRIMAMCLLDS